MIETDIKIKLCKHNFDDVKLAIKWILRYIKFIEHCQALNVENEVLHVHHIFPRAWGGDDDLDNLVALPIRHHVVAHQLLARTCDSSMINAFNFIVNNSEVPDNVPTNLRIKLVAEALSYIAKSVVNLNTGEIFYTLKEAAIKYNVDPNNIAGAIKYKCKAGKCYWQTKELVDQYGTDYWLKYYEENRKQNRQNITDSVATPVVNLTTGQVFNTCYDADRFVNRPLGTVKGFVRDKRRVDDDFYQYKSIVDQTSIEHERQLLEQYEDDKKNRWRVVCLDTGTVYANSREADQAVGLANGCVAVAISNIKKAAGCWWAKKTTVDEKGIETIIKEYESIRQQRIQKRVEASRAVACKPVINLVTGIVYNSGIEASRAFGKCDAWCQASIKNKRKTSEYQFEYYHDDK